MYEELEKDIHPADSQFPLFKSQAASAVRHVTLNPGELLYIPPYWLVRAEFPVLSLFLDVPSLSEELVNLFSQYDVGIYLFFLHYSCISKKPNSPMFLSGTWQMIRMKE